MDVITLTFTNTTHAQFLVSDYLNMIINERKYQSDAHALSQADQELVRSFLRPYTKEQPFLHLACDAPMLLWYARFDSTKPGYEYYEQYVRTRRIDAIAGYDTPPAVSLTNRQAATLNAWTDRYWAWFWSLSSHTSSKSYYRKRAGEYLKTYITGNFPLTTTLGMTTDLAAQWQRAFNQDEERPIAFSLLVDEEWYDRPETRFHEGLDIVFHFPIPEPEDE